MTASLTQDAQLPTDKQTEVPLFSPLTIRGVTFRNRITVSPMCQYSSEDGFANDWHFAHLGSRAVGGAALVIAEASAVLPEGRISPGDLGIWKDAHIEPLKRIAHFIHQQGAVAGIQLAHAGRKASTQVPWEGSRALGLHEGGWQAIAPSPIPFRPEDPAPHELTVAEIKDVVNAFAASARRALQAGFQVVELHGAHGYLLNEFLSPLANQRTDKYGGSFENRIRLALEIVTAVRHEWPEELPLFLRISAQDWAPGGWTVEDSTELAKRVKPLGVDLIDASSGGVVPHAKIAVGPAYQTPFAEAIRRDANILTGAVGMITEPAQANDIIKSGKADLILIARAMLHDPYWALHAAKALGVKPAVPKQYSRGF